ncbi:MAG: L,D-transpeptidase [Lachnospiraceae bacterium]|nr:L,D-transpeptidase [Lachnospiraceae bacterium]
MKQLITKLAMVLLMAFLFIPLTGMQEARAEGETVNYVFTGHEIPEGQAEVLTVDAATLELFKVNPAIINVYVAALAERYNTATEEIDRMAEAAYLTGVISGALPPGNHVPQYTMVSAEAVVPVPPLPQEAQSAADAAHENTGVISSPVNMDIGGGNYIDINISTQTLTLFQNGIATYAVPVVTGNVRTGHRTPEGLFSVQYKQLDRTLKGEDYESFVHYWMRIVNNVGIHDASWRSSFGGNIYMTNGSHGCINVPPSLMPPLYEVVPVGYPVWVHS